MNMDALSLRNFRDFMLLYNETTERCFNRCVNNFNSRKPDTDEMSCVNSCAGKHINFYNKIMSCYVTAQNEIMSQRMKEAEEMEKRQILSNQTS